jgi:hypothetical protein
VRTYSADSERRIRLQAEVCAWARNGLLDAAQASAIEATLRTDLKRTAVWLRLALAAFTAVVVAASVALPVVAFNIGGDRPLAVTLMLAALVCFAVADYLAGAMRLYRYGVEEMLAVAGVTLLAYATVFFFHMNGRSYGNVDAIVALVVAASAAVAVYARFGFVYAAVGAMICAAFVPFQFQLSEAAGRLCAAAVCGAVFVTARARHLKQGDDFPGDEYATLQAAACAGVYVCLNLWVPLLADPVAPTGIARTVSNVPGWFYWGTWAAGWGISLAALAASLRRKDRQLLAVAMVLVLLTLATNKPYLGIMRQSWDPMLLGVLLAGGAVAVRRWLASGPGGHRNGYTADRVDAGDRDLLRIAANTSVAWHGRIHEQPARDTTPGSFDGGRSGGGGSSAGY